MFVRTLLLAGGLLGAVPAFAGPGNAVFDVSIDGTTFVLSERDIMGPEDILAGDTFVVTGTIFAGGTIPEGGTVDAPSTFGPDEPGGIGTWICRGSFVASFADIMAGTAPIALVTTQVFKFDDGRVLVTEGEEGAAVVTRTVTGGTVGNAVVVGAGTQTIIGINETGVENLRFDLALVNRSIASP